MKKIICIFIILLSFSCSEVSIILPPKEVNSIGWSKELNYTTVKFIIEDEQNLIFSALTSLIPSNKQKNNTDTYWQYSYWNLSREGVLTEKKNFSYVEISDVNFPFNQATKNNQFKAVVAEYNPKNWLSSLIDGTKSELFLTTHDASFNILNKTKINIDELLTGNFNSISVSQSLQINDKLIVLGQVSANTGRYSESKDFVIEIQDNTISRKLIGQSNNELTNKSIPSYLFINKGQFYGMVGPRLQIVLKKFDIENFKFDDIFRSNETEYLHLSTFFKNEIQVQLFYIGLFSNEILNVEKNIQTGIETKKIIKDNKFDNSLEIQKINNSIFLIENNDNYEGVSIYELNEKENRFIKRIDLKGNIISVKAIKSNPNNEVKFFFERKVESKVNFVILDLFKDNTFKEKVILTINHN